MGLRRMLFLLLSLAALAGCASTPPAPPPAQALHSLDTQNQLPPDTALAAEADSMNLRPPTDIIQPFVPEREDCNNNGVPDAVDIREGTEDDSNHNGIIDACEPDTNLPANPHSNRWRALRAAPDTSYFWAGFRNRPVDDGGEIVAVRYTVPGEGARVRLDVFDARGFLVATPVNAEQDGGAYESAWNRAGADGKVLAPGMYRLRLTVDGHTYVRRVRWAL
jgi:flagellar hook capping protein FlgD